MNSDIRALLEGIQQGTVTVDEALLQLKQQPFEDIGYAKVDMHRKLRQGAGEVIYGAGKTAQQIIGILTAMASHGQKNVGTAVHAVLLAVLLLLHVGGIYAMLTAEISLSWVLAALLSSAVIGISLGRLQEILFSRPGEMPADASGAMPPTETETEAEANAPDGDGTEAEAEANAPDGDGTETKAETDVPDGSMSGDVPPEADSAPTDAPQEAHDTPAMPDTADAAEEETASAAPDRTEKGAQDR